MPRATAAAEARAAQKARWPHLPPWQAGAPAEPPMDGFMGARLYGRTGVWVWVHMHVNVCGGKCACVGGLRAFLRLQTPMRMFARWHLCVLHLQASTCHVHVFPFK